MPRYRFVYEGWEHGEEHSDDEAAREAIDEGDLARGLIRVERLPDESSETSGGTSPHCSDGSSPSRVDVVWRKEESKPD